MNIQIWTDGGFSYNNKVGSWSFLLFTNDENVRIERYGIVEHHKQTSQVAEMMAIIQSLEFVMNTLCAGNLAKSKTLDVEVTTDSQYCVNSINDWMHKWYKAGWPDSKENQDLWQRIHTLYHSFKSVKAKWVKGHAGIFLNERVDQLNQQALIEKGLR